MTVQWPKAKLGEITSKVGSGATPRGGANSYHKTGIPLIRSMNVHFDGFRHAGLVFIDKHQARELDGASVEAGDVLLNITGASIGRVTQAPDDVADARVNQHVCIIRPRQEALLPAFLCYFLRTPERQRWIMEVQSGATRQALTKEKILGIEIPLPPIAEQRRIVAKIDDLMSRSLRAKRALDSIPGLLDQFRQSLLAWAFRGDLTAVWRQKNPDVEPAGELLKRIRRERRKRWEDAELAKMHAKGKVPEDDRWKSKYEEPVTVTTNDLPKLPIGWEWASTAEIGDVKTGRTPPGNAAGCYGGSTPFYKPTDLDAGFNVLDAREYLTAHGETFVDILPPMSVLVTCIGATIGKTGLAHTRCATNQQINAIIPAENIDPGFLYWTCSSEWCQDWIKANSSATTLPILNKRRFERMPLAIPPAAEQMQICAILSKMYAHLACFQARFDDLARTNNELDHSVLSKAFRGELVPQDPNDEPASAILERLRNNQLDASEKPNQDRQRKPIMKKQDAQSLERVIQDLPSNDFTFEELRDHVAGDYDKLKKDLFALLGESNPMIRQVFDTAKERIRFERVTR